MAEALALQAALGVEAAWLAGGTALQLGWPEGRADRPLIDIARLDFGPVATLDRDSLSLAATARLEDVRHHPLVLGHAPVLAKAITGVAATGVRHLGTLGGNLCWAGGDLRPLFLAMHAVQVDAEGKRRPFAAAGVGHPLPLVARYEVLHRLPVAFEKIGLRAAFSPSLVTVAASVSAGVMRTAVGGGPVHAQVKDWDAAPDAGTLARWIVAPDDDLASGMYRQTAAARVLAALMADLRP